MTVFDKADGIIGNRRMLFRRTEDKQKFLNKRIDFKHCIKWMVFDTAFYDGEYIEDIFNIIHMITKTHYLKV